MGFFDDVSVLAGKGMNAVDRKTKSLKLQADLSRISNEKKNALTELGRLVYAREGENEAILATYGQQIQTIRDFELQESNLREQIAELQNASAVTTQAQPAQEVFATYCASCGAGVPEGSLFCIACGTRVEAPEAPAPQAPEASPEAPVQQNACPSCGTALEDNSPFCPECGQRIESGIGSGAQG